jgi:hypothetical protein
MQRAKVGRQANLDPPPDRWRDVFEFDPDDGDFSGHWQSLNNFCRV